MKLPELLTISDIAKYCHASEAQVVEWLDADAIKSFQSGGDRMVATTDLMAFLKSQKLPLGNLGKTVLLVGVADDMEEALIAALHEPDISIISSSHVYESAIKMALYRPECVIFMTGLSCASACATVTKICSFIELANIIFIALTTKRVETEGFDALFEKHFPVTIDAATLAAEIRSQIQKKNPK